MIWKLIGGACVATVLTQIFVLGLLSARGNLDGDKVVKIIGLVNGIDITGDRLKEMLDETNSEEMPSYDEVIDRRAATGLDMDLKMASFKNFQDQLETMSRELKERTDRFEMRRVAFEDRLAALEEGMRDEGMREMQTTLEALPPEQAKVQLLKMFDQGEIDTVVYITQAMPVDKRKKIFSEFAASPEEQDKLNEILWRYGEGGEKKSLIDGARADK